MNWAEAQGWLCRAAYDEWRAQGKPILLRRARAPRRYVPPPWHISAMAAMGRGDEEAFKAIRLRVTLGAVSLGDVV